MTSIWGIGFSKIAGSLLLESLSRNGYQIEFYTTEETFLNLKRLDSCKALLIYAGEPGLLLVQQIQKEPQLQSLPMAIARMSISHQKPFWESEPAAIKRLAEVFKKQGRYLIMPWLEEDLLLFFQWLVAA